MNDPEHTTLSAPHPQKGRLFIISAPSGAGKTTLCRRIRERYPDLRYSISYTTRKHRAGEIDGRDYYFIDTAAFIEGISDNKWAEWAVVHGHYYGTSAEWIDRNLAAGHDVLLDIDVQGTRQMLRRYPDAVTIFILPPSMDVLRKRLESRNTDRAEEIEKRLVEAENEMAQSSLYRHVIVNDQLTAAADALASIID